MAIALSDISLPVFIQMLGGLDGLVDKAAAYCADRKVDPDALLHARLAPSMYDFARQIRAICDWPVLAICHTTGAKAPEFAAGDTTFADLKARIATTVAFVQSADRAAIDAAEKGAPFTPDPLPQITPTPPAPAMPEVPARPP